MGWRRGRPPPPRQLPAEPAAATSCPALASKGPFLASTPRLLEPPREEAQRAHVCSSFPTAWMKACRGALPPGRAARDPGSSRPWEAAVLPREGRAGGGWDARPSSQVLQGCFPPFLLPRSFFCFPDHFCPCVEHLQ